jgi:hypothetical protein
MDQPAVEEETLAPLVGLVDRLRAEITEVQGRWEALGGETKRQMAVLAEATVELLTRGGAVEEETLAPLVGLVDRLRAETTELQGRWEALREELESKRQMPKFVEATVELLTRVKEEAAPPATEEGEDRGGQLAVENEENDSQGAEASVCHWTNPQEYLA